MTRAGHGRANLGLRGLPLAAPVAPALPPGVHDVTLYPSRSDVDAPALLEIRAQLAALLKLGASQAEQMEGLKRQVREQSTLASAALQSVHDLRSQVNSLRVELMDTLRGVASQGNCHRALIEERRNTRKTAAAPVATRAKAAEVARASSGGSASSLDSSARLQSAYGFTRSPPGLSMWATPGEAAAIERVTSDSDLSVAAAATAEPEPQAAEAPAEEPAAEQAQLDFFAKIRSSSDAEACAATVGGASAELLNSADSDAWTSLHYAALYGYDAACEAALRRPDFLMGRATDRNGNTALHIATLHDKGVACAAILRYDAEMAVVRNHFGETPVDLAKRRGISAVCAAFAARGLDVPCEACVAVSVAAVSSAAASL